MRGCGKRKLGLVWLAAALGGTLMVFAPPGAAAAQRISVCASGPPACNYTAIADAVAAASDGDVIAIHAGTYSGGFTVDKDVVLSGAGPDTTTISGGGSVVTVAAGTVAKIKNVTITGGNAAAPPFNGGGIDNLGNLTVINSVVTQNNALGTGGGIYSEGPLALNDIEVSDNTASFEGPGICSCGSGSLTITTSTITGNTTFDRPGGGVFALGPATIKSSEVSDNVSADGGGGVAALGDLTIRSSTISGNFTSSTSPSPLQAKGGGIQVTGAALLVRDSTVSGNTGGYGGGIWTNGTGTVSRSSIASNTSATMGGGIANDGTLTLRQSSVTGNLAQDRFATGAPGGGIFNAGSILLLSTSVTGNTPDDCVGC